MASLTDEQLTLVKWRLEHGETSKGAGVYEYSSYFIMMIMFRYVWVIGSRIKL